MKKARPPKGIGLLVAPAGIEPARPFRNRKILSLVCLPIPPGSQNRVVRFKLTNLGPFCTITSVGSRNNSTGLPIFHSRWVEFGKCYVLRSLSLCFSAQF